MKRSRLKLSAAVVLILGALPCLAGSNAMPRTLQHAQAAYPAWVDASIALNSAGELDPKLFPEPLRSGTAQMLALAEVGGCHPVQEIFVESIRPEFGTLDDAIGHADVIVSGRVTGKAFGFYSGNPGQLLEVTPSTVHGASAKRAYYVFVPVGTFRVGAETICKTDKRYPVPPEVGQDVFVFGGRPSDVGGQLLATNTARDVIAVERDGSLRRAVSQQDNAQIRTKADLTRKIREHRDGKKGAVK